MEYNSKTYPTWQVASQCAKGKESAIDINRRVSGRKGAKSPGVACPWPNKLTKDKFMVEKVNPGLLRERRLIRYLYVKIEICFTPDEKNGKKKKHDPTALAFCILQQRRIYKSLLTEESKAGVAARESFGPPTTGLPSIITCERVGFPLAGIFS